MRQRQWFIYLILNTLLYGSAWSYSGGNGSHEDPYQIASAQDILTMAHEPNDYHLHFVQTEDIFINSQANAQMIPIGSTETPFLGSFNGRGHTIYNLDIHEPNHNDIGLFGHVGREPDYYYQGETLIKNTHLVNAHVLGQYNVGLLVGKLNYANIESCSVQGIVKGEAQIGGLVGHNRMGWILFSSSHGTVQGGATVGGLVGDCDSPPCAAIKCFSTPKRILIQFSMSSASVTGSNDIGGLVGRNTQGIEDCYATGDVSGDSWVGGLIGNSKGYSTDISRCYAIGAVSGKAPTLERPRGGSRWIHYTGGLIGEATNVEFNACAWNTETQGVSRGIGYTNDDPNRVLGLSISEMKTKAAWEEIGWYPKIRVWDINDGYDFPHLIWEGYKDTPLDNPEFTMTEGGGDRERDPYHIYTTHHLLSISDDPYLLNKHFRLMNDVDLDPNLPEGQIFNDAVISSKLINMTEGYYTSSIPGFSGTFDGNGYTVKNITIHALRRNYVGLFDGLAEQGYIENLKIINATILGYDNVGILAGVNKGQIYRCMVKGFVEGRKNIGILIGYDQHPYHDRTVSVSELFENNSLANINRCSATGTAIGSNKVGGLVGWSANSSLHECNAIAELNNVPASSPFVSNDGHYIGGLIGLSSSFVKNCYAMGTITGDSSVGGLIGSNGGTVAFCYAAVAVEGNKQTGGLNGSSSGDTFFSYWDTDISRQSQSEGGMGLTTNQMQTIDHYKYAGWNFNTIWAINNGYDYPYLKQVQFPPKNPDNSRR